MILSRLGTSGVEVHAYSPAAVKLAVVGHGAAEKEQVAYMVVRLLGLHHTPQADAADAEILLDRPEDGSPLRAVPVGTQPYELAVNPATNRVYVANHDSPHLQQHTAATFLPLRRTW